MRPLHVLPLLTIALSAAIAPGCGEAPERHAPVAAQPPATSGTGTVRGRVVLAERVPIRGPVLLNVSSDAMMASAAPADLSDARYDVNDDRTLPNAVVWLLDVERLDIRPNGVRSGDGQPDAERRPVPSEPVLIDMPHAVYRPFVQAARVGQTLRIVNPACWKCVVLHELDRETLEFSRRDDSAETSLRREGLYIVRCEVHSWLEAWVHAFPHPHYATTGASGTFEIADVPAGSHVLRGWHPLHGAVDVDVTVVSNETSTFDVTLPAPPR